MEKLATFLGVLMAIAVAYVGGIIAWLFGAPSEFMYGYFFVLTSVVGTAAILNYRRN